MAILNKVALSLLSLVAVSLVLLPASSALAAPSPWWQVLTGSRPTSMWEPQPGVLEIETELAEFFGEEVAAAKIEIEGTPIGCLGVQSPIGTLACEFTTSFSPTETAGELEALLNTTLGPDAVKVTGGPVGGDNFIVTSAGAVPALEITPAEAGPGEPVGSAALKVISPGGSGRLVLTITNLGDAPVDASGTPVTIVDELPEGAEANRVEGFAGAQGNAGPVSCSIEASDLVSCSFEDVLPSYEAIEVEIVASLKGDPPVQGAPGRVTVSGGNAPAATAAQAMRVSPERVPFGVEHFSAKAEEEGGASATRAGGHPFQLSTTIALNSGPLSPGATRRDTVVEQPAMPRNLRFPLPAGVVGVVAGMPQCDMALFLKGAEGDGCPDESAVGVVAVTIIESSNFGLVRIPAPLFNLPPAHGEPARFGFLPAGVPLVIDTEVDPDNQYRVVAKVSNATQLAQFLSSTVVIWGSPGDPRHDTSRGWDCIVPDEKSPCARPQGLGEAAFLRQPVSCVTPMDFHAEIEPWNVPYGSAVKEAEAVGESMNGCNQVPFSPSILASPTNSAASSSSGLDFRVDMPGIGLLSSKAKAAEGQAKKVEVALPEGVTVNPSQANGLGSCAPADYARERYDSRPGEGCPESSKIGTVDIATPLLEDEAHGSVYVAEPYDNPLGSLVALYMVAKIPQRGILVKQAGKVELDPKTGRIVTTFDDLPQVPFDSFNLHFREGSRAPLVMPPKCGTYEMVAEFTPWHASDPNNPLPSEVITRTSSFSVDQGLNGAPCPSGTPAFKPGFVAGAQNNAAGSFSPFIARLTRDDDEQEFSRFSMKLPKGVIGKIAGIPFCSDAAIAAARARTGPDGGQEELDNPSCPAASQIGRTLVGAGVGPALSYAPGKIYLAGPYQGSKLSIVAITTAKVGPFDLGTVVIRQALKVNPETAEVSTDGTAADPIPHILQGIVAHARDIRVYVDRPDFVLNPTSCKRMAVAATVFGSGLDFGSAADDQAANVDSPFQAAGCASLGFKPKLSLRLRGGTRRGDTPRLRAVLEARKGDANIGRAQVTMPHSAFLEQSHIRTVCTRVQFRAGGGNGEQCPKASIYGRAKAISPLLDEPLVGPVVLRSSDNPLPDLVGALHSSKVDVTLVGRIDSLNGRIRSTFDTVPDAPVTKFILEMQGGDKGLIVNSTNICKGKHRATADFSGQNGRGHVFKPLVKTKCAGKAAKKRRQAP